MNPNVILETVPARLLAAVRQQVRVGQVTGAWRPALDQVWAFLRQTPGLRTDGHNIFLYHHPARGESILIADFGVQVTRPFAQAGEVYSTTTPSGKVASALHVGPYERMSETHSAILSWVAANSMTLAGKSWEIRRLDGRSYEAGNSYRISSDLRRI
jgi:effector-binding domain-containing protein